MHQSFATTAPWERGLVEIMTFSLYVPCTAGVILCQIPDKSPCPQWIMSSAEVEQV